MDFAKASVATVAAAHANEAAAQQAVQQANARLVQAEANQRAAQTGPQQAFYRTTRSDNARRNPGVLASVLQVRPVGIARRPGLAYRNRQGIAPGGRIFAVFFAEKYGIGDVFRR